MPARATAFELVIRKGSTVVYKSGVLPPSVRRREIHNPDIVTCAFTPDIYANQLISRGPYEWQVYAFTPTIANGDVQHGMNSSGVINAADASEPQAFNITNMLGEHAGSFNINVDLAFFTPDSQPRDIYVEAFTNAAFAGHPAARTVATITAARPALANATLYGLDSEEAYYVRAYVRANPADGDAPRQPYDPWGYVCEPPRDDRRYDPLRITDTQPAPTYWLPMYATDINNNRVADISEMSNILPP
jgi:hypothetical protein